MLSCCCISFGTPHNRGFPGGSSGKEPACQRRLDERDRGFILGSGRFPGEGIGNPLQYSCLENPMDRGAWRAIVHRVTKSRTWLKWRRTHTHPIQSTESNMHPISEAWMNKTGYEYHKLFQENCFMGLKLFAQWTSIKMN